MRDTSACGDCLVSFLVEREPDDAVIIDATRRAPCGCSSGSGSCPTSASSPAPAEALAGHPAMGKGVAREAAPPRHQRLPPKVGGIQVYLWELWRRLDPESFAVLTASSHPDAAHFDAEQAARGVRIERVPEATLFFPTPGAIEHIRQAAAAIDASLILLDPALPLGLAGPRLGLPYGVLLHGAEVAVPARFPGSRQALGHVLAHADLVIAAGAIPPPRPAAPLGGASRPSWRSPRCRHDPVRPAQRGRAQRSPAQLRARHGRTRRRLGEPPRPEEGDGRADRRRRPTDPKLPRADPRHRRRRARRRSPRAPRRRLGAAVHFLGRVSDDDLPRLLGRPTCSSWPVGTAGSVSSRRASASSSWRPPPPGCPRSPATAGSGRSGRARRHRARARAPERPHPPGLGPAPAPGRRAAAAGHGRRGASQSRGILRLCKART